VLHVRVTAPKDVCARAADAIRSDETAANLVVLKGAALDGTGDLLTFDVARENANTVIGKLSDLGVVESGSISLSESMTVLSRAGDRASTAAVGHPDDGVVWSQIEEQARDDARLSWSFIAFLLLATLIAGIGRYLDQPILIIGAMVVGPEFAPLAAICVGLVRRRPAVLGPASITLFGGFALAAAVAWLLWGVAALTGVVDPVAATTGPNTEFIVNPDGWSFVIALLAGCAGILSITSAKSSALVGVFISITTVPAVGTIGLTLAVGAWGEAGASAIQLAVNVAGLLIGGVATLAAQTALSHRSRRSTTHGRR
jgi:uncharacterized hydrophobic protein (TIGR00271 family)